jgi:hypothetical protein
MMEFLDRETIGSTAREDLIEPYSIRLFEAVGVDPA